MEQKFSFADYILLRFKFNFDSGYYERFDAPPGFKKLPFDLTFENTQRGDKIDAPYILRGRRTGNFYSFLTGLRNTPHKRIFYGDDGYKNSRSKSFLFAVFTRDSVTMDIYFFNCFYPHNSTQRERIIQEFVEQFIND